MQGILYGTARDFLKMYESNMAHNKKTAAEQKKQILSNVSGHGVSFEDLLTESMQVATN